MVKIKKTNDGSHTLYEESLDEYYHSVHGAVQESLHVFIRNGFNCIPKKEIKVFEMGFGTGLNALLTYYMASVQKKNISYTTIEKFPLNTEITEILNYSEINELKEMKKIFEQLHQTSWEEWHEITSFFRFCKIKEDLVSLTLDQKFDLIYFDAFSPDKQPELWTTDIFEKLFSRMNTPGIFVTYSAKGIIRRRLENSGFKVERISGPPGKREMLRALKE